MEIRKALSPCSQEMPASDHLAPRLALNCEFRFSSFEFRLLTSLLPAFALAQAGDVRDVMPSVPGVQSERIVERHGAALRVLHLARKIRSVHSTQQIEPALVQRVE